MGILRIFMFGGLRVLMDDDVLPPFPTRKTRSLFAYLVTYRGRAHSRHFLAGMFWGDAPEARAQRNLNTTLWRLRRALPSECIRSDKTGLAFNTACPYWLDVEEFETELGRATGKDERSMEHLQDAIRMYRGDFLQGMYDDWLLVEAERLRLLYRQALQRLFAYHRHRGEPEKALAIGQQILSLDPLREDVHLGMMETYLQMGRRGEAVEQFRRCSEVLQRELSVDPLPETQALYRRILDSLDTTPAPAIPPAGHTAVEALPRTPFDDFGQAPWVGRAKELAIIERRLESARNGHGSVVLVGGVAGVGKTRLAEQAASLSRAAGMEVLWGTCSDLQEPPPYQGLTEVLRKGLDALEIETSTDGYAWLADIACLLPEIRHRLDRFRRSPPDGHNDAYSRSRLLPAIWHLLRSVADRSPCLIILDDIHWADTATLEALRYFLSYLRSAPVLLLATFRPEELHGRTEVARTLLALESVGATARINLAPLSTSETECLVQRALGLAEPHPVLGPLIYRETEGNPFFIGEVLKAMVEERLLYLDPKGGWRTPWDDATTGSQHLPSLPLPRSIRRLVEHRLERLSPTARSILNRISVLGRDVDFDLLSHICDSDEEELLLSTDELLHRHIMVEAEEGIRFSHDKIRQTVYENLSRPRRRSYHRRAGEALVQVSPDRVEEIAYHFHQTRDHSRTLEYAMAAGERARRLYANRSALTYYGWVIDAAHHLKDMKAQRALIEAHEQRGRIHRHLAAMDQAAEEYRAMAAAAETIGDLSAMARAMRLGGWVEGNLHGEWEEGLQAVEKALVVARRAQDLREESAALRDMGAYHNLLGEYPQSLECLQSALEGFRTLRDKRGEAGTLQYLAVTLHFLHRYEEATKTYEDALKLWQALEDRLLEGKVLADMGYLLISAGRLDKAYKAFVQAERTLRQIEAPSSRIWAMMGLAVLHRFRGQYQDCLHLLSRIESEEENLMGNVYVRSLIMEHRGMSLWHLGRLGEAIRSLQNALALARESRTPSLVVGVLTDMGRCHRQMGNVETALRLHRRAAASNEEERSPVAVTIESEIALDEILLGDGASGAPRLREAVGAASNLPRWNRAEVLANVAEGMLSLEDAEAAEVHARRALEDSVSLGVCSLKARCHLLLGRSLAGQERWEEAESVLQEGLESLPSGGAPLFRSRLSTLLARVQIAGGHKDAAAATQVQAWEALSSIGDTLPDPDSRRRWRSYLEQTETGVAFPYAGQVCLLLPRRDDPVRSVAVVWTVDAGDEDQAIMDAQGKVALRRRRIQRLQAEADVLGAVATEPSLSFALGVSIRTIRRDLAALRRQGNSLQAHTP